MRTNIFKYLFLALATSFLVVSCDEEDNRVIFDVDNGETIGAFNANSTAYPVPDTGDITADVVVGVTTRSSTDRTVNVSVDPSSTATPDMYTIPSSLTIPAGEFTVTIPVQGVFDNLPEVGDVNLVLNLESVEGGETGFGRLQHTVNMFRFCPFENGATFLGDYMIETVTTGIFGVDTFVNGVVTLTEGDTIADRNFVTSLYPAFGGFGPFGFKISLICGDVVVPDVLSTGVGCGGCSILVTPPDMVATFDLADDSSFEVNYTDDRDTCCNGPFQITIRFTKI